MGCAVPTEAQREARDNLNKLKDLFDGHTIRDIDGKSRGIGNIIRETYKPTSEDFGQRMFAEIVWKSTYKPADEAYSDFTKGDYRRIANEIEKEAKKLNNPKLSWLEKVGFVKRGVMGKFAVTRWMNKHINLATNYERTKFSVYLSSNTAISKHIRAEIIRRHPELAEKLLAKITPGIKDGNTLDKFERNLIYQEQNLRAIKDPDQRAQKRVEINEIRDQIAEVLESDGGKILKEVVDYLEASPVETTDFRGRKITVKLNKEGQRFATNIELAGEDARSLLNDMGGVLKNGIDNHISAIKLAFNKVSSPRLKAYERAMKDHKKGITEGIEKGDYFPHFITDSMMNIEKIVDKIEFSDSREIQEGYLGQLEDTWAAMRQSINSVPGSVKDRSRFQYENWIKNPLTVLRKYSMDAIAFNRTNRLKNIYMEGIKNLPKDPKIARELNDYINDVFTLAGRGYRDRPVWVNKAVRVLTGYEFLSKIGFGVATAARNTMSAMYYIQSVGNLSFMRYMRDWNKSGKEHDNVREIMSRIEQEQGFRFEDLSSPLFTEGLLPTEGKQISDVDIVLDPQTGVPSLQYKNKKGWQTFDNILTRSTGYGAIFQKVTENFVRKHMFRYSFKSKYNELVRGGRQKTKAERDAKQYALDMVNKYAFEYSASQKAPVVGGTTKNLGAAGQVAFQFMHYPMSFLQTQSEILRNSKDAVMAKQWDNPDLVIPIKFAGLYLFTQLMSGVGNVDFNRLMENDTMDRLIDIKDVMEGKEDIKGRGYIGPAIGDLFFLATLKDFIELPDNQVTDMIVGYNNAYKLTDEQKSMRLLSTFNVEMAKVPRNWKALQNGTIWNVMMHEFGLYPKGWTKEMRRKQPLKPLFPDTGGARKPGIYTGTKKKKKKKKGKGAGLESDIELQKLYRAMGI